MQDNQLTEKIIGLAMRVHSALGPGLINFNMVHLKSGIKRVESFEKLPSLRGNASEMSMTKQSPRKNQKGIASGKQMRRLSFPRNDA